MVGLLLAPIVVIVYTFDVLSVVVFPFLVFCWSSSLSGQGLQGGSTHNAESSQLLDSSWSRQWEQIHLKLVDDFRPSSSTCNPTP